MCPLLITYVLFWSPSLIKSRVLLISAFRSSLFGFHETLYDNRLSNMRLAGPLFILLSVGQRSRSQRLMSEVVIML